MIVAVIDSGVAYDHPDLNGNIWVNNDPPGGGDDDGNGFANDTNGWDFVQNDNTPLDYNGHGTHVAGTIGAEGNNATRHRGRELERPDHAGAGGRCLRQPHENADLVAAINYACANGANIVNGSFGGPGRSSAISNAISRAPAATRCSSSPPVTGTS